MKVFNGAAWREIVSAKAYIGGAWRTLTVVKAYNGGAWRSAATFVSPISISLSPNFVSKTGPSTYSTAPRYLQTGAMAATPTGGLAPYTYAWTIAPGSGTAAAVSSTSASSAIGATLYPGGSIVSNATCTVTDSLGSAASADGAFELYYSP